MKKLFSILLLLSAAGYGQSTAIDLYLPDDDLSLADALMTHSDRDITGILPQRRSGSFTQYVKAVNTKEPSAQDFANVLAEVESLRMNKLVGASSGVSGTTSVVSRVAAPAVLGVGVEYGGILQQNNGTVTTLRANLLGVTRLALGEQQFPYCAEIAQAQCKPASRWLRRFSSNLSFEHINTANGATVAIVPAGSTTPTVAQLFTSDNRMASWGARFDLTASNNLDDPKYIAAWHAQIAKLRAAPEAANLINAVTDLFQAAVASDLYSTWNQQAVAALKTINDKAAFKKELAHQLDDLIQRMSAADPKFQAAIAGLDKAYNNYFQVRDSLIREAQTNKFSLEYTNQHPLNQPFFSNFRLIYSHQPTNSQTLITLNAGLTFYHQLPAGIDAGRLRDVQVAGQLDRRLGQVPKFGYAVFTLAGYFQYMQHDSIIIIGPGNMTPGSGIILPGTAASLLGTKGAIGVVQAKVSIPVAGTMKIPLSVTWSNRTELINEKDLRAQIGLTLDFDSLFH